MSLLIRPNYFPFAPSTSRRLADHILLKNAFPNRPRNSLSSSLVDRQMWQAFPEFHVTEDDEKYSVAVEVPGIKQEDMNIELEDNGTVLHFTGTRTLKTGTSTYEKKCERRVALGSDIDTDQITASVEDGVLNITLVKLAKEEKAIPITQGGSEAPPEEEAHDGRSSFAIEVPGIKPEDMDMRPVNNGRVLHFTGTRKLKEGSSIREKKVERRLMLGDDADTDKIRASVENGILDITIHKKAKKDATSRAIPITQGATNANTYDKKET